MIEKIMWQLIKLRNIFSRVLNSRRPSVEWRPEIKSVQELKQWVSDNFEYKHDPLGGYLDNIKSVGYMCWEYRVHGKITGDCDDIATFVAWALSGMDAGIAGIWRVNIPRYGHVLCVWKGGDKYFYSSNRSFYAQEGFASIREIVDHYAERTGKKIGAKYYAEFEIDF